MAPYSSTALLEPFVDLLKIKSDVFSEFEMGNRVGRVLSSAVVDERDGYSEGFGELSGGKKVVQGGG